MRRWSDNKSHKPVPLTVTTLPFSVSVGPLRDLLVHSISTVQYLLGTHCGAGAYRKTCAKCAGLVRVLEACFGGSGQVRLFLLKDWYLSVTVRPVLHFPSLKHHAALPTAYSS